MNLVNNPEKTLLIGHGYWGKIIEKNLKNRPVIFDISKNSKESLDDLVKECSHVIISTPASTHFDIVDKALDNNCKIFCEKPLTVTLEEAMHLYEKADSLQKSFYVDWIFLCNPVIRSIKELIRTGDVGDLKYATMNRLNLGPARTDVNARFDLSSHDLSILVHFLGSNLSVTHYDLYQKDEKMAGTSCSHVKWENGEGTINTSWNYPVKDRTCIFTFEKCTFHWDDSKSIAVMNGTPLIFNKNETPLQISLRDFFEDSYDFEENKRVTLEVTKLLRD
jgi:predicted dehydrogenase